MGRVEFLISECGFRIYTPEFLYHGDTENTEKHEASCSNCMTFKSE